MARNLNQMTLPEAEAELAKFEAQRARNLERWRDQDVSESGFSERACDAGIGMARARVEILKAGGAPFTVLIDTDSGRVVAAAPVETRFGWRWCVRNGLGACEWLPYAPKRAETLAKKGYREDVRLLPAEVTCSSTFAVLVRRATCTIEQANAAEVVR